MGKHSAKAARRAERRVGVLALLPDVREEAEARGLRLQVGGDPKVPHWIFHRAEGGRLMEYWPVKGTWWCQANGTRGRIRNVFGAVEFASRLSGKGVIP